MIPAHQLLFMIGLMCFPSISFGDALQKVNDAVNCLNQQSNKNEELRISNTAGPVARTSHHRRPSCHTQSLSHFSSSWQHPA